MTLLFSLLGLGSRLLGIGSSGGAMPIPEGNEGVNEGDILEQVGEDPDTRRLGKVRDDKENQADNGGDQKEPHEDKAQHHQVPGDPTEARGPHLVASQEEGDG